MATLNIEPNIAQPDDFYEVLIDTHRELSPEQSQLVNAKLILLLANHIGDANVLRQAMERAREGVASALDSPAYLGRRLDNGDRNQTRFRHSKGAP
jgi:hypothetical protein